MDHHDLQRRPGAGADEDPNGPSGPSGTSGAAVWAGEARITASILAVGVDSDQLFRPEHVRALTERHAGRGRVARYREVRSPHGHDAFLLAFDQLEPMVREALALPPGHHTPEPSP